MIWFKLWLIANELMLLALLRRAPCPTVSHRPVPHPHGRS